MLVPVSVLARTFGVSPKGVLHVGAHEAEERDDYARFGWGPVIWVEMLPDKAELLRAKLAADRNSTVINAACWDEDGRQLPLYRATNGQSSSLLPPDHHLTAHPEVTFCAEETIATSRLDTILPESAVFDFINLDIQGAELRAMMGLGARLSDVSWAYVEVNRKPLYAGCALLPDLERFLKTQGFYRVVLRMAGKSGWGDALFVNANKLGIARVFVLRGKGIVLRVQYGLSEAIDGLVAGFWRTGSKIRRQLRAVFG
jgi:FkbM family methyltransferase